MAFSHNRGSIDLTFCFLPRRAPAQYRRITRLKYPGLTIHAGPHGGLGLAGWRYSNESLSSTTPGRPFSRWALLLQLAESHKLRIHLLKPHHTFAFITFSQHRVTCLYNKSRCPGRPLGAPLFQSCLYSVFLLLLFNHLSAFS